MHAAVPFVFEARAHRLLNSTAFDVFAVAEFWRIMQCVLLFVRGSWGKAILDSAALAFLVIGILLYRVCKTVCNCPQTIRTSFTNVCPLPGSFLDREMKKNSGSHALRQDAHCHSSLQGHNCVPQQLQGCPRPNIFTQGGIHELGGGRPPLKDKPASTLTNDGNSPPSGGTKTKEPRQASKHRLRRPCGLPTALAGKPTHLHL